MSKHDPETLDRENAITAARMMELNAYVPEMFEKWKAEARRRLKLEDTPDD